MATVFRAKLLDATWAAGPSRPLNLPAVWVPHCKAVGDGHKALLYLSRYLYRSLVREADILRCDAQGNVTFQYRHAKTDKTAQHTLPGADFLWLVPKHVLPRGLRRSRNFGFLHPNSAGAIRLLQVLHPQVPPAAGQLSGARARTPYLAMHLRPAHARDPTANAGAAGCERIELAGCEFAANAGQTARKARRRPDPHDAVSPPSSSLSTRGKCSPLRLLAKISAFPA